MYTPTAFSGSDTARLHDLVERHSFGTLIATGDQGELEIAHLPFLLDRGAGALGRLRVHVARANPIWSLALRARQLVAVFAGPHGYVSPRWYQDPTTSVPTWNYVVVHAHGRAEGPLPGRELLALISDLTNLHERGAAAPWRLGTLDPAARDELAGEIVGLSIAIERLEGKLKLSQNRSPADRARVAQELVKRATPDDVAMARLMADE